MPQALRQVSQLLIMSLWRRKSMMLAVGMCATIVIVCLQYSSVGSQNSLDNQSNNQGASNKNKWPQVPLGMYGPDSSHNNVVPRRNLSSFSKDAKTNGKKHQEDWSANEKEHNFEADAKPKAKIFNAHSGPVAKPEINIEKKDWVDPRSPKNGWVREQVIEPDQPSFRLAAQQQPVQQQLQSGSGFIPALRLVHFDMKGAPPKVSYLKQLFPLLKEAGANGVILEYEDTFPFWGPLAASAAGNAYTKEDITNILNEARSHQFEVIPLIQTFGHLEYVLKLEPYKHMREVEEYPQAICPSKNDSIVLVKQIVDQVVALHPGLKWLHIGCDEVYHLGYCNKCMQQDRENLFLSHVARVAQYVREHHNIIPIVWDDMLRQIPLDKLKQHKIGHLVEPMIWTYVKDVYRFIPYNIWLTYSEIFPYIWGASAFKGAFGETLTVPNVRMHLENHEAWLEVMSEQQKRFQSIRGLALTGWQRYDHFASLCELLPSGLPSLFVDLITVTQGHYSQLVFPKMQQILQCTTHGRGPVDFEADPYLWQKASGCFFPGSAIFKMTQHLSDVIKRINDYIFDVSVHKAWLTSYNVRHNMSSPMRVDEGLSDYSSNYYPLTSLMRTARDALREVYDEYTVSEWIEQNVYPYVLKMEKLWKDGTELKKARVWPKRPLAPLQDLKRFQIGDIGEEEKNIQNL